MIIDIAVGIRPDVHFQEVELTSFKCSVGIIDVDMPIPNRFYFCALQNHSRFHPLHKLKVSASIFIFCKTANSFLKLPTKIISQKI